MRTLEEIIETMTLTCDVNSQYREQNADVLHYLKSYRDSKATIADVIERYTQAALWHMDEVNKFAAQRFVMEYDNPPLTWEQLKQMEGKPVWVEVLSDEIDLSSRWMLVARETKAHSLPLAYTDDIGHWIFGHEDKLGKAWQAYRKER